MIAIIPLVLVFLYMFLILIEKPMNSELRLKILYKIRLATLVAFSIVLLGYGAIAIAKCIM